MAERESRLTMTARALGFAESASSVELLTAAQQKLVENQQKLEAAKTSGTVGDVGRLTEEQQKLNFVVEQLAPTQAAQVETQDKINAKTQDYIGILNKLNPRLGEIALGLTRAVRISGELADTNLSLSSVMGAVTAGVEKFGGALKLLGAGGFAFASITFLINQIQKVREEAEKAAKSVEDLKRAATEREAGSLADTESIVTERDKQRRLKPFTFAEQETVRKTLEAAPEGLRERLGPILAALGGGSQFGPTPGGFLADELLDLTRRGFTAPEGASQPFIINQARRFLGRQSGDISIIETREQDAREAQRRRAAEEAAGPPAALEGQANLARIIEEATKGRGVDDARIRKAIEDAFKPEDDTEERAARAYGHPGGFRPRRSPAEDLTGIERAAFDDVMRQLDAARQRGATVIINNNQNSRNIVPGQDAQRRARSNGDSIAAEVEMGSR